MVIKGRVQGVSYRYWASGEAQARRLAGYVRNRSDGAVEAEFHGPSADVDDMVSACHQGPAFARVDSVDVLDVAYENDHRSFEIRSTV
ncbi:MAG: acylphosphatase [Proteobacteria bacterium]|nr:acylphosphatase [Pseudomonadota bacterium]MDA1300116.1 acylphosphatase [Pseudomonadota bacterium]